jgi:uncharacterized protein HemY
MKAKEDATIKYQLNFLLGFLNLKEHFYIKAKGYFKNCLERYLPGTCKFHNIFK